MWVLCCISALKSILNLLRSLALAPLKRDFYTFTFVWDWFDFRHLAFFPWTNGVSYLSLGLTICEEDVSNQEPSYWSASTSTRCCTRKISNMVGKRFSTAVNGCKSSNSSKFPSLLCCPTTSTSGCSWALPQWLFIHLCWGNVQCLAPRSKECSCCKYILHVW